MTRGGLVAPYLLPAPSAVLARLISARSLFLGHAAVTALEIVLGFLLALVVGVGLAIAAGVGRVDLDDVSCSYMPYLWALLAGLALVAAFPWLTLVLPRLLLGYRG